MEVVVIRTKLDIKRGDQLEAVFEHIAAIRELLGYVSPRGSCQDPKFGPCCELCSFGGVNNSDTRLLKLDGGGYVVASLYGDKLAEADNIKAAWNKFFIHAIWRDAANNN